jgi:DNA modification methylase
VTPWLQDPDVVLYHGDVLAVLRELPTESVDCCVTSPPYWGLRDYGQTGQLGLEPTPEEYVTRMVEVFREVRRVLAPHGTVWLNLGDSYAQNGSGSVDNTDHESTRHNVGFRSSKRYTAQSAQTAVAGLKAKDLCGIPWRVAFALQADGWYLRSDIIWAKPNPMPESVTDRPTKAHEYVFLLSKQPRYFFDQEAVREPPTDNPGGAAFYARKGLPMPDYARRLAKAGQPREGGNDGLANQVPALGIGRNIRSVWEIATQPYPEAHFATFPEELARRCIAAGCPEQVCRVCGKARERIVEKSIDDPRPRARQNINPPEVTIAGQGTNANGSETWGHYLKSETLGFTECGHDDYRPGLTLDPFMGSGTVAYVARKLGRHAVGIDLNESYLALAARRLQQQSLFAVET